MVFIDATPYYFITAEKMIQCVLLKNLLTYKLCLKEQMLRWRWSPTHTYRSRSSGRMVQTNI